jgi:acyl carrier protein
MANPAEVGTGTRDQMATSNGPKSSEEALAKIWAEVLRLPQVDKDANFFEVGGDSLKAMEVIARVSEVLHVDLPLVVFFEDPTIAHLAAVISGGRTPSEEALATIWAEVLRLPRVDTSANFFDIGGDSLKAMEVIARVSDVLQVDLPLLAYFEDPTVSHLAAVVDELKPVGSAMSITRIADRGHFPLSYSQQVFWLLEQQNPGTGIYNTTRTFRIHGKVDATLLERSLNELLRRHEILRVRFSSGIGGPIQTVEPGLSLRLAVADLSSIEPSAREQAAQQLALQTIREPFNLSTGPLMRARLIRLDSEKYMFCMPVHHVVSDGFTGSIVLEELGAIYDAFAAGEPSPLPDVGLHFTDYAAWEQQWMRGSRLEQEMEHWRALLQGVPSSVDLPTDFAPSSEVDRDGRLRAVTMPHNVLRNAQAFAKSNGTTLFTVLAAALRILLFQWSGQSDFLLGTVSSNRSRSGTERMIGCFVNQLPLRNPVSEGQSAIEVLRRENNTVMEVFAHQDCPFPKIVEAANPERSSNDNPLLNVSLVLQNFPVIALDGRHFQVEYINFDAQVALLDMRFIAMETRDGLEVSCEYKHHLFSEGTIDALLRSYETVLQSILDAPSQVIGGIALPEPLAKQAAKRRWRAHVPVIAITASFTAEPVGESLNFLLGELGMHYRVAFAPYQQVFQQLLDPTSQVRTADGFAIVLVRFEDWLAGKDDKDSKDKERLGQVSTELIAAIRAAQHGATPLIVCFCPESRLLTQKAGWREFLCGLEGRVAASFVDVNSLHFIGSQEILETYPVDDYEDEYAQRLGNVPYTTDFFSAIGTMLARRMWNVAANRYKVIAVACNDVLWSGQSGANQPVTVDDQRRDLQRSLLKQRDSGVLLCLCSKNATEEDVWAAFESNPDMPLQRDDFVATAIGPRSSVENLRKLASELGFDLDSFIFVESDSAECSEVEAACPEVMTLQAPADPAEIPAWLKHVWAFDRINTST